MERNQYNNIFLAIVYSFFSRSFYQHALRNWQKKYMSYLLLVIFILSTLVTARIVMNMNNLAHAFLAEVLPTMPTLELKEGKLTTKPDKPYFIYLPKTHLTIAVIDTKDQYKNFSKDVSLLLMSSDKFYIKMNSNDIRAYIYNKAEALTLDPQILQLDFNRYHLKMLLLLSITTWIITSIALFVLYIIFIGFLAIFTSTIAGCADIKFNYRFYLKLTLLAATLPSIVFIALYWGHWLNLNTFLGYLFLQVIYLILSVFFIHDIKK